MRRPFPRPVAWPSLVGAIGFALVFLLTPDSRGQDTSGSPAPLARYVPKDDLVFYFEFDGLDAHAEAWRKTAAYKILNNTPTGAMFEEVLTQLVDKLPSYGITGQMTGAELVSVVKHIARSGFICAGVMKEGGATPPSLIVALRDAYKDKGIRATVARYLQKLNAPNTKPQAAVRAGHKVITGVTAMGQGFAWWVEDSKKEDIVLVFPKPEAADIYLETLDGKRPSAVEHPQRAELMTSENGFVPTGVFFLDSRTLKFDKIPPALGLNELKKFDLRFGFQDDALMTITRISAPSPHKGLLALLDGPTFDKGKLPPIPETVSGFSVVSLDLKTTYDTLIAAGKIMKPDLEETVNQTLDLLKTKPKLRIKEDILGHLGPKVAWYILPAKAGATTPPAAPAPSALPSMISMGMASLGLDQIPRLAIVFDIDDSKAFGKVLDEVMAATNREFKNQAAKKVADAAPGGGGRNRGLAAPAFQFQLMPGETKSYVLSVPPELTSQLPSTFRPAIRVGPKHMVIAVSADLARLALEAKGTWAPPNDLGLAFQKLSSKLKMLEVADPRDTIPAILAAFPGKLQTGINTMMLMQAPGTVPPVGSPATGSPPGAMPGGPGASMPGPGGAPRPMAMGPDGGPGRAGMGPGPMGPGMMPNGPGGPGAKPAGPPSTFVIQFDAAKLPSADSIKALLFPSIYYVEVLDDEIRIVSREAFPLIGDPSKSSMAAGMARSKLMPGGPPPGIPGPSVPGIPLPGAPGATPPAPGGPGNREIKPTGP